MRLLSAYALSLALAAGCAAPAAVERRPPELDPRALANTRTEGAPVLLGVVPTEVAANRFMLLDRNGNPRGYLGLRPRKIHGVAGAAPTTEDEWGFALWDKNAQARVEFTFGEERPGELVFRDGKGEVRARLLLAEGETRLTVTDPSGRSQTLP